MRLGFEYTSGDEKMVVVLVEGRVEMSTRIVLRRLLALNPRPPPPHTRARARQ